MVQWTTLKDLWPTLFNDCNSPGISLRQFTHCIIHPERLFHTSSLNDLLPIIRILPDCYTNQEDLNKKNGTFSVKPFYKMLIDGGTQSSLYPQFWKIHCPRKIMLFCWLVWEDKILTFSNLFKKVCNQNRTDTCVLYHKASENVEHLFVNCEFTDCIWNFFFHTFSSQAILPPISKL